MKKHLGKALAMAVMMSVLASGSAYAEDKVIIFAPLGGYKLQEADGNSPEVRLSKADNEASLWYDCLRFEYKDEIYASYHKDGMRISGNPDHKIYLNNSDGLDMGNLQITNVTDITASGTITAGTSGEIKSGETGLVNGGAVYTALQDKADKASSLAGYGITDAYTKSETDTELAKKADQAALDTETKERKDADDNLQKQINAISGGSSAGLNELNNKINQTDARLDRVGATAAALAAINYQPMTKGQSQVAVGMGGYKGKKATAIGMAYQFSDRVSGSVAGSANGSEHMFNVGFNYLFGQHTAKDVAQCAVTPGSMSLKEAEMQATIDSQNAKINSMEARMAQLEAMVKDLAAK